MPSVDGIGAYDHIFRSAMLSKLTCARVARLVLLPFVRLVCSRPTQYSWEDVEGVRHQIRQRVGRDQGDPPMPLLFSLGIHDEMAEVHAQMTEQSTSSSFLTTCMSRQVRNEFVSCTNCRPRPCIAEPGSVRTQTRRALGIKGARSQRTSKSWVAGFYALKVRKFCARQWGARHFQQRFSEHRLRAEKTLWDATSCVLDVQLLIQCESKPIRPVRFRVRRGDVSHHGDVVAHSQRVGFHVHGSDHGVFANASGRVGVAFGPQGGETSPCYRSTSPF